MTRTTLLGLLLFAQVAHAQQSVIEHCRKTSSDADRIACLEAALLGKALSQPEETQAQIDPPSLSLDTGPSDDEFAAPAVPNVASPLLGSNRVQILNPLGKNTKRPGRGVSYFGGEGGIRTHGTG